MGVVWQPLMLMHAPIYRVGCIKYLYACSAIAARGRTHLVPESATSVKSVTEGRSRKTQRGSYKASSMLWPAGRRKMQNPSSGHNLLLFVHVLVFWHGVPSDWYIAYGLRSAETATPKLAFRGSAGYSLGYYPF